MYSLLALIGLQHPTSLVVSLHPFFVAHLISNDLLNLGVFKYPAASLHDDLCYFLIQAWCCSVALQYLAGDCLPSRIFILWENLYCTLLTAGTFSLSVATWCPTCFLRNSVISSVIRTSRKLFDYGIPELNGQHPFHFLPFWWCHEAGSPLLPPRPSWWPSSIAALKRALLSNHCCPVESLLCPQSHPYVLLLNYPG